MAGREGLDDDVRGADELAEDFAALLVLQVEGDAALAGVEVEEVEAALGPGLVVVERGDEASGVALRRFHLDHIGPEVGEELGAVGADVACQVEDADVVQGRGRVVGHRHYR